jgi:hypothetical protein
MRREKEQVLLAEQRIQESIERRARGEEWRYEGREEDLARIRRWRKDRNQLLLVGGGGG